MIDWLAFMRRLEAYPRGVHRLLPPSSVEAVAVVEMALGKMPLTLKEMLEHFNGGKLFSGGLPYLRLFRLSNNPSLSPA